MMKPAQLVLLLVTVLLAPVAAYDAVYEWIGAPELVDSASSDRGSGGTNVGGTDSVSAACPTASEMNCAANTMDGM